MSHAPLPPRNPFELCQRTSGNCYRVRADLAAARKKIDRMRPVVEAADRFTSRPTPGSEWRNEVSNDEYQQLCSAVDEYRKGRV